MNHNRLCNQRGHEMYYATHLCTFKECNLQYRWCCIECLNHNIHNHGRDRAHIQPLDKIILYQREILELILEDNKKKYHQYLIQLQERVLIQSNLLQKFISQYQSLQQQLQSFKDHQAYLIQLISDLKLENFIKLSGDRIYQLLYNNHNLFNQNQQLQNKHLESIDFKIKQLENIMTEIIKRNVNLKQRKYIVKQIDETNNLCYSSYQMMNNSWHMEVVN